MTDINPNRIKFYEFLNGDLPLELLESWIYRSKELEIILSADDYFDLIEFNFKSPDFKRFLKSLIRKYFDWNEYELWRTIQLLEAIKNAKIELVLATRKMKQLYLEQEEEIKTPLISRELAIGYESVLDTYPIEDEYHLWNPEAMKKQLEQIQSYQNKIIEVVDAELIKLLKQDINQ